MTIEELSKLSDEELCRRCAELAGHEQLYFIRKPKYAPHDYYRPNACGYTSSPWEAWKVTKEVADTRTYMEDLKPGHEHYGERVIAEPVPPPSYVTDLNAMHEAERTLPLSVHPEYYEALFMVCTGLSEREIDPLNEFSCFDVVTATGRQRCIAFIAVMQSK